MHCGRDVLNVLGTKEKKGCRDGSGEKERVFASSSLDEDGAFRNLQAVSDSINLIGVSKMTEISPVVFVSNWTQGVPFFWVLFGNWIISVWHVDGY